MQKFRLSTVARVKNISTFKLGQNKGGLIIIRKSRREKPFKILANRTIGLHRDTFSIGLENAFNSELKGKDGERMMRKVAANTYIPVDNVTEMEAKKGNDIVTTINIGIQEVAEESLYEYMEKHLADKGCAIVMETKTGAIKAVANLGRNEFGELTEDYNYAIAHSTEPGSTMKLASTLAMLETGKVDVKSGVDLNGGIAFFYNEKMEDSELHSVGMSDLEYAFSKSSNVGIAKLATAVFSGNKIGFADYYQQWNLNKRTE